MREHLITVAIVVAGWWLSSNPLAHATNCISTSITERFEEVTLVTTESMQEEEVAQLESVVGVVLLQVFVQASVCLDAPGLWPLASPWALGPCAEVP